jgi:hypothetical protein
MKSLFLFIFLSINPIPKITRIATINQLKKEAETAFQGKFFNVSANKYKQLIYEEGYTDERAKLNLAHACYYAKDTTQAFRYYGELTNASNKSIQSVAHQQMGNLRVKAKDLESALLHYKSALKAEPTNEGARQNYEVIKRILEQQKKQQQQNQQNQQQNQQQNKKEEQDEKEKQQQNKQEQDKNKQNQPQQDKQQQKESQTGENKENNSDKKQAERDENSTQKGKEKESEQKKMQANRLQQINMTEEQAKMILEAMKSSEVQYLQQNQRKAAKKQDKSKPDW